MSALSASERVDRLRLARSDGIGPVTFRELLENFPSAGDAIEALPELASRGGRKSAIRVISRADAEREIKQAAAFGARLMVFGDADFPRRLAALDPPPPVIAVQGALHLLEKQTIAIVGSRNASAAGMRIAGDIARELGERDFIVVSGLARGIDAAAHRGSLKSGTVAVVGGGLDIYYPDDNKPLQLQIAAEGAVVAEMPLGTKPQGKLFPRRNRIISGLSMAVVVVEAAMRSGSLITARLALEQGRDVFAVPGSPLDPRALGSNGLIKQGAALVENADDVIAALGDLNRHPLSEPDYPPFKPAATTAHAPDEAARRAVLSALGPTPVAVDEILRLSGVSIPALRMILLELDLAGRLRREPGDRVSLLPAS